MCGRKTRKPAGRWSGSGLGLGGVRHHELDRVRVERGEGEGRLELVVLLVDALVERARVQRPVGVEEEHLVDEEVEQQHCRPLGVPGER
eukprot:scaffold106455_cov33-Phaeocystis_antarctica.AAC.1